jgi:hypothetical protein
MKNPARRGNGGGAENTSQIPLIEPPPSSRIFPKPSTLPSLALALLCHGKAITSPEFQAYTGRWRLAAYIHVLIRCGWPVESVSVEFAGDPTRTIARYSLPAHIIAEVARMRHEWN